MQQAARQDIQGRGTRRLKLALMVAALTLAACGSSSGVSGSASARHKPNVIVILADDVGFSDLSAFGSEIATPNLDALVSEGRVMSNMHATPLCATSRAELLTGADHHLVGVDTLPESTIFYLGRYTAALGDAALTVAQRLLDAGYHTYMAGKWHLGGGGAMAQGFEQSFSLDDSAAFANNFWPVGSEKLSASKPYFENGVEVTTLPDDFFSSDYFTSKLKQYIGSNKGDGKPFFAYLAFQATHFPLQAPDAYLDLYKGQYDGGYDAIRGARLQKQKDLGLIPADFKDNPGDEATMVRFGQPGPLTNQSWDSLSADDKKSEARIMEVFAGMLTNLDDNVGKLVAYLKEIGEYDNTMIVFVSDNGPDGMGYGFIPYVDSTGNTDIDNGYDNYGRRSSFLFRSTRWAEAGAVPLRLFKSFTAEGGISVPAIVRLPKQTRGAASSAALGTLRDIVPTILDVSGVADTGTQYQGRTVAALEGASLKPVLDGSRGEVHGQDEVIADEVNDIRYVRKGNWKATRIVNYLLPSAAANLDHDWQLYDMSVDRGETNDLAAAHPDKLAELVAEWQAYVARVGVRQPLLPPLLPPIDE
ncbi:arylsulfatase [Solimonas soli]|uniref:arylsulfatase n=1 Tax=Solimonas soli TaxID=413479 RepID=UPI0004AD98EE|nr:arylsulfatase [Solimonas soli]